MERRLEATETARALFESSSRVLLENPSLVFAPAADTGARLARRFPSEIAVQVRGGSSVVQSVTVELGLPKQVPGAMEFDLNWQPAGHAHLLPVFRGSFTAAPEGLHTRLSLQGTYSPPFGPVGTFGDGLVGHRLARQTINTFLRNVARRIDQEVDRRMAEGVRPTFHHSGLRKRPTPENWLG